jgi:hypothetical protein
MSSRTLHAFSKLQLRTYGPTAEPGERFPFALPGAVPSALVFDRSLPAAATANTWSDPNFGAYIFQKLETCGKLFFGRRFHPSPRGRPKHRGGRTDRARKFDVKRILANGKFADRNPLITLKTAKEMFGKT